MSSKVFKAEWICKFTPQSAGLILQTNKLNEFAVTPTSGPPHVWIDLIRQYQEVKFGGRLKSQWEAYNTTASMSSDKEGVQAEIARWAPDAEYQGCCLHSINLVICHACKIKSFQNMMDSCHELFSFFDNDNNDNDDNDDNDNERFYPNNEEWSCDTKTRTMTNGMDCDIV